MSQFLSQVPRQQLQQTQRLTPQQIQSLNILQLGLLALESQIEQELDANPALERVPDEAEEQSADSPPEDGPPHNEPLVVGEGDTRAEFERLDSLVREYSFLEDDWEYRGSRSRSQSAEDGDAKLEAMANTPSRPEALHEYLLEQWSLLDVDERTRQIGQRIIEHISDNGRLEAPLAEIAQRVTPPASESEVEAALERVQELEPAGIAARSLRECLLIQLWEMPGESAELARQIIEQHFEDLQKNRLPLIASRLGITLEELKAALRVIARLSLHPGAVVEQRQAPPIVPDVLVEFDEKSDTYEVRLSRGNTRELRISREFREALESADKSDKKTREFLKEKLDAAKSIIDAVRFRRERLLDVARSVVEAQRDFLDHGEQHLRVLRMSDVAARLGCDPSTISRTVDDKHIQTPRGIFPLRRFFTGGAETVGGESVGWDSIRAKVQEIIAAEDKRNPLSDDEIVHRLAQDGIYIKRRTVAKYRAQLAIPTRTQRRRY